MKYGRLPNGYGSIVHLKGNLRHPYLAKTRIGLSKTGKAAYRTIGTYETYAEAFDALMSAHTLGLPPEDSITFADLYERFYQERLIALLKGNNRVQSTVDGYRYAFQAVPQLHGRDFLSLTAPELQQAVDEAGGSASRRTKIKLLFSQLYQFADYHGITDRNLAQHVHILSKDHPDRNPFTLEEIQQIRQMPESHWKDCILIMLYTGMRVGELFTVYDISDDYFRAGLKTDAGRDRLIPIHPEIKEIVRSAFPVAGSVNALEHWFKRNLPGHTPHDCRRTFVTRADQCGMNPTACRQIVGHTTGDVHLVKYTLHHPEYLYQEMLKLSYAPDLHQNAL